MRSSIQKRHFPRSQWARCMMRCLLTAVIALAVAAVAADGVPGRAAEPRYGRVLVVANSRCPASGELAAAYALARRLPAANVLRIPLDDTIAIDRPAFRETILDPVNQRLRDLGDAVDYIAVMRGIPYRVDGKSVTAALAFGGLENIPVAHGYAGRSDHFERAVSYYGDRFRLSSMVSGYTVDDAVATIQRSKTIYADPKRAGTFYFCAGDGPRGTRNRQIEPAMMRLRRDGFRTEFIDSPNLSGKDDVLGQFTGTATVRLTSNTYLPGSIVDNMTSFGGFFLERNRQTSALAFLLHGASGSYGTVAEPTNHPARWADYTLPARYAAGFNLAESYWQTVRDMSLGVVVGDPLTAPFASPCDVRIEPLTRTVSLDEPARLSLNAVEGRPGEGIAWLEVWLNDMTRVYTWSPPLPSGTQCSLVVRDADDILHEAALTTGRAMELHEVLGRFQVRGQADERGTIHVEVTGRHSNRLLIRWQPAGRDPKPTRAAFTILAEDGTLYSREISVHFVPVTAPLAVFDFGSAQPEFGDQVTIAIDGQRRIVRAVHGETLDSMLGRLQDYLKQLPAFQEAGPWLIRIATPEDQPDRRLMYMLPQRTGHGRDRPDIEVAVRRSANSAFAPRLERPGQRWHDRPLGLSGEGVITPFVPTARVEHEIVIPPELLSEGPQRVLAVAGTPRGTVAYAETVFLTTPSAGQEPSRVTLAQDVIDLGDTLAMVLEPNAAARDLYPVLILDGRPVANWRSTTRMATFPVALPSVAPGLRRLWIEWTESPDLPDEMQLRSTRVRSEPQTLTVRRPLSADVTWQPRHTEAGKPVTLTIDGPYLREGLNLVLRPHSVQLERDPQDGMLFRATLPALPKGTYVLSLMGDPKREKFSELPGTLEVR